MPSLMRATLLPHSTLPSNRAVNTVAIIGAGPLGRRLALAAARAGLCVLLEDVMPQNLDHAQEYIRRQLNADALSHEKDAQIAFVSSIEDAVRQADLIIDCVPITSSASNPSASRIGMRNASKARRMYGICRRRSSGMEARLAL